MTVRAVGRPHGDTAPATRRRLIESGLIVFARDGYEGATVAELVARAKVSAPVLYHHFGSKAGLYLAATADVIDTVIDGFRPAVEEATDLLDCIDRMLRVTVQLHVARPQMARFLGTPPPPEDAHDDLAGLEEQLQRTAHLYQEIVARHGPALHADARPTVDLLHTMNWGLSRLADVVGDDADRFGEAVELLRVGLTAGLRA